MKAVERIPFEHLKACPDCGRVDIKIANKHRYPSEKGLDELVVYNCPNGHRPTKRQLIVRAEDVPPKKLWEGYAT